MPKAKAAAPTGAQIADALGITPGRVSQLKGKGMPVGSIAAAQEWYVTRQRSGVGHLSRKASASKVGASAAHLDRVNGTTPEPAGDGPEAAIWRVREAERLAFAQYRAAVAQAERSGKVASSAKATAEHRARHDADLAILPGLLRTHGQAVINRQAAERAWEKHRQRVGLLVPFDAADAVIEARLAPLDQQLRTLARHVAPAANPQDPATAERAIDAALATIFDQISAARRPTPAPNGTP